jgi:hypothetical protein
MLLDIEGKLLVVSREQPCAPTYTGVKIVKHHGLNTALGSPEPSIASVESVLCSATTLGASRTVSFQDATQRHHQTCNISNGVSAMAFRVTRPRP